MNNDNLKLPDDIFQEGLDGFEAPYNEAAWVDMRDLLDKTDRKRPFLLWFRRNKKTTFTLITITMITTTVLSIWALLSTGNTTAANHTKQQNTTAQNNSGSARSNPIIADKNTNYHVAESATQNTPPSTSWYYSDKQAVTPSSNPMVTESNPAVGDFSNGNLETMIVTENSNNIAAANNEISAATETPENAIAPETPTIAVSENDPVEIGPQLSKKGSENSPKKGPSYTNFRGPWIGIHFTMQNPENPVSMDSGRQQAGFNLQFMSANLIQDRNFGAYLGGDFGAQFYGRGKSYGVVLNNTELDSGFTRLSMHSFDFLVRGHFEYARFRLKPYINGFAGPRIYATSQYTEAYHHKQDYENSDNTNAHTSVSFMYGGAAGLRFAVSKHVSLDARVEYMRGTDTRVVDLDKSTFEGSLASFSLHKFNLQPAYYQYKFGVLFDLWDGYEEEEKEDFTPLNNEVTQTSEYYYFDSTTNQYIKVNCRCVEKPANSDTTRNTETNRSTPFFEAGPTIKQKPGPGQAPRNSGGFGPTFSPGGSSGSRGGFPGIKSGGGGGGIKIRN